MPTHASFPTSVLKALLADNKLPQHDSLSNPDCDVWSNFWFEIIKLILGTPTPAPGNYRIVYFVYGSANYAIEYLKKNKQKSLSPKLLANIYFAEYNEQFINENPKIFRLKTDLRENKQYKKI